MKGRWTSRLVVLLLLVLSCGLAPALPCGIVGGMSDESAPALPESLPTPLRSQTWGFFSGLAVLVLLAGIFLWMRSAKGTADPNHEAGLAPCCVP